MATALGDGAATSKYAAKLAAHVALVKKVVGLPAAPASAPSDEEEEEEAAAQVAAAEKAGGERDDDDADNNNNDDDDGWVVVPEDNAFVVSNLGFHGAAFLLRAGIFEKADNANPHKQVS
eukprot:SAG22_NODE_6173_length_890_cov_1.283186_1_plen_119_part_10